MVYYSPVTTSILHIIKVHPEYSLVTIARICGTRKQTVNTVCRKNNIPYRYNGPGSMDEISTIGPRSKKGWEEKYRFCLNCTTLINKIVGRRSRDKYCSEKCRTEHLYLKFNCRVCNKQVLRRKFIIRGKIKFGQANYYCSQICYNISKKYRFYVNTLPSILI